MNEEKRKQLMQKAFDRAYIGVIKQGKPSANIPSESFWSGCLYRGLDGTKCGIGHLVTDYMVAKYGNTNAVTSWLPGKKKMWPASLRGLGLDFLESIQDAHDSSANGRHTTDAVGFLTGFKERMAKVANTHGLTIPDVQ